MESLNLWHFAFGLGIFLLGMQKMERGLEGASEPFVRRWLHRYTQNPLLAVFTGIVITALLQSSSLVTLIMMAMVGARLLPLRNAIGVVIGANLGTTFTGWLVTFVGFKLSLDEFAIPLLGIGAIGLVFFDQYKRFMSAGTLAVGLGLLLFGLELMKNAVGALPELIDFEQLKGLPSWVFFLSGAAITAIIQSSSATMIITLSLLNAQLIGLNEAAAFIIGADLGTTSTSALAAIKGQQTRKRLAIAHISFNVVVDFSTFFFLLPLLPWLLGLLPDMDPLYQLVFFHSCFNFIGLLCFLPFLEPFTRWLNRHFKSPTSAVTTFINEVPATETKLALIALSRETRSLHLAALAFCKHATHHESNGNGIAADNREYLRLKRVEGEIIRYASMINDSDTRALVDISRHCIYAAKAIHDSQADWQLSESPAVSPHLTDWQSFYHENLDQLKMDGEPTALDSHDAAKQLQQCKDWHERQLKLLQDHKLEPVGGDESHTMISSLLNLNRELLSSLESFIEAALDCRQLYYQEFSPEDVQLAT